jgi:hypothetical protein
MSLESANYPNQLVATNPPFDDPKNQGDDHIRLIKNVLTVTFANVGGVLGLSLNTLGAHVWSGSHDFSGATFVKVPTLSGTENSTKAASTQFVNTNFIAADHVWSGNQDFSAAASVAVPNPVITSNSNTAASTQFVQALFTATPASLAWRSRMMFYGGNR